MRSDLKLFNEQFVLKLCEIVNKRNKATYIYLTMFYINITVVSDFTYSVLFISNERI